MVQRDLAGRLAFTLALIIFGVLMVPVTLAFLACQIVEAIDEVWRK